MYSYKKLSFVDDPKKSIRSCQKNSVCIINYIIAYVKNDSQFNFKILRKKYQTCLM